MAEAYELLGDLERRGAYERDGSGWAIGNSSTFQHAHWIYQEEFRGEPGDPQVDS